MKKRKKEKTYKKKELSSLVFSFFERNPTRSFNYKQVCASIKVRGAGNRSLCVFVLEELVKNRLLDRVSRGSFKIKKPLTQKLFIIRSGYRGVYVVFENKEYFIEKAFSCFALLGDYVEVVLFEKKHRGRVYKVLKRKKNSFVGTIESSASYSFLVPNERGVYFDVFIPSSLIKGNCFGKRVLVVVGDWSQKQKNPVAEKLKILGDVGDYDAETNSILHTHNIFSVFSKEATKESVSIKADVCAKDLLLRKDFRGVLTFTIDPEDAKDFDDAISIQQIREGVWEVGVHIADVSHYVKEGSALDKEALKRGSSVYLVGKTIPMLPEVLSNGICSLKPGVDRLAFSVLFEISLEDARVLKHSISKTVIHSKHRFSYSSAQESINSSGLFYEELVVLNSLAKKLKKNRIKEGSIEFSSTDFTFVLDKKGNPINCFLKKSLDTHSLIEEFMLLTNRTVAKEVGFLQKIPFVYRVHDLPDLEKVSHLGVAAKSLGYSFVFENPKKLSSSLNALLKKSKEGEEKHMIEKLAVRSMSKAYYSTKNIGHYGLSFKYYSHFTSPIRRYPDLLVHRMVFDYINNKNTVKPDNLEDVCKHCSVMEKKASLAERDSIKYMQTKYLKNRVGFVFDGIVSGVSDWGIYVELVENNCEGLVKLSSIKNDHYVFNKKQNALVGYRTKSIFRLGQKVVVKVSKADLEKRQLDFILV